jgi:methyl-accepting chemotaxis protein
MPISQIITPTNGGIAIVGIMGIMSLLEVSKIEINPWTYLARKFGNAINHDISEQIKEVNQRIDNVESSIDEVKRIQTDDESKADEYRAITSRVRILKFNEELLRDVKHSKEMFDQVLEDVTKYTHYCNKHPNFENDKAVLAINNVRKCYEKCLEQHDFI